LLLDPAADKAPEVVDDSLLEAVAEEELLEAADLEKEPSGET